MFQSLNLKVMYDLSIPLDKDVAVFPGDPPFKIETIRTLGKESSYTLKCIHLGNHTGTHIDFPAHVIQNGKTSSDFNINHFFGRGIILECNKQIQPGITADFILNQALNKQDEIIFFKGGTFLELSAAKLLVQKKVKIIGIDSLSVDNLENIALPIHHILLENDILIVENLNLSNISSGRGEILIAPIPIPDIDGAPARVIMWK